MQYFAENLSEEVYGRSSKGKILPSNLGSKQESTIKYKTHVGWAKHCVSIYKAGDGYGHSPLPILRLITTIYLSKF
jgi:hypothetical protein